MAKAKKEEMEPSAADGQPAEIVVPAAAAEPYVAKTFKVKATKHLSHFGQMTTFHAGTEISEAGHGIVGVQRLKAAGLELEEIKG